MKNCITEKYSQLECAIYYFILKTLYFKYISFIYISPLYNNFIVYQVSHAAKIV
jgi:hypothetical protein